MEVLVGVTVTVEVSVDGGVPGTMVIVFDDAITLLVLFDISFNS